MRERDKKSILMNLWLKQGKQKTNRDKKSLHLHTGNCHLAQRIAPMNVCVDAACPSSCSTYIQNRLFLFLLLGHVCLSFVFSLRQTEHLILLRNKKIVMIPSSKKNFAHIFYKSKFVPGSPRVFSFGNPSLWRCRIHQISRGISTRQLAELLRLSPRR